MNTLTAAVEPRSSRISQWFQNLRRGDKITIACAVGGILTGIILGSSGLAMSISVFLAMGALWAFWDNGGLNDFLPFDLGEML